MADLLRVEDDLWDEWFDVQYDLTAQIDRAVDGICGVWKDQTKHPVNRSAARASLYASILEHCGEKIRNEIVLYTYVDK